MPALQYQKEKTWRADGDGFPAKKLRRLLVNFEQKV